jgi:hypothetical protein
MRCSPQRRESRVAIVISSKGLRMKFIRHTALAAATAALGLTMLSTAAQAGNNYDWDRKSYTGAQCQPAFGNQSNDFTIYQGRLRNDAAGVRWVSCAITLDAEDTIDQADGYNTTTSAGGLQVRVWLDYSGVPSGVTSYTTNCTIAARDPDGLSLTETVGVTSAKTTTQQAVNFQPAAFTGTVAVGNDAAVQVSCLLPSKVALSTLKVYENGRTDEYSYTP